jgi:hypothetical protein
MAAQQIRSGIAAPFQFDAVRFKKNSHRQEDFLPAIAEIRGAGDAFRILRNAGQQARE